MTFETVKVSIAQDGEVTLPGIEDMPPIGQVMRDPQTKKWVARAVNEGSGKLARTKTEHATRSATITAILAERGLLQGS